MVRVAPGAAAFMAVCRLSAGQFTVVAYAGPAATTTAAVPTSAPAATADTARRHMMWSVLPAMAIPPVPGPRPAGQVFHHEWSVERVSCVRRDRLIGQTPLNRLLETLLEDRRRQVATRALQHGAQRVGRAA